MHQRELHLLPFLLVLLSIRDLRVELGGRLILDGVSFDVDRGQWIGVIGPNGCGKTTLLKSISGFLDFEGVIEIDGRAIDGWKRRELARTIAFVRQNHELNFEFEVKDLVMMGKTPHKGWLEPTTRSDIRDVRRALEHVGLTGFADRDALSLSGGELQRVFLAQALVQDAGLLLLDEPTTHLDVYHQYDFLDQVQGLVGAGRAAVTVFHDLSQASRYCDYLLVIQDGRQLAFDPPAEVLKADLIRSVFRMHASIAHTEGVASITYLRPSTEKSGIRT